MKHSTPRLAFGEPSTGRLRFYRGINTTVRLGAKWMKAWIKAGEQPFDVVLLGPDGRKIGMGKVTAVEYMRLSRVNDGAYLLNHAGPFTHVELIKEVHHAYASVQRADRVHDVTPTDSVTVVYFIPNQE